jgi:predicted RNase H-like HicB family nuclease
MARPSLPESRQDRFLGGNDKGQKLLQGLKRHPKQGTYCSMKFAVTLDRDEDGIWVVECPSIPGCVSQGKTKPEALKNIREAIELCLEVRAERGLPLTVETRQVEVAL